MKINYGHDKKEDTYHIFLGKLTKKQFEYLRILLVTDFNREIHEEIRRNLNLDKLIGDENKE